MASNTDENVIHERTNKLFVPPELVDAILKLLFHSGDETTYICLSLACKRYYFLHKAIQKKLPSPAPILTSRFSRLLTPYEKTQHPSGVFVVHKPLYQHLSQWIGPKLIYSAERKKFIKKPSRWQILIKKSYKWMMKQLDEMVTNSWAKYASCYALTPSSNEIQPKYKISALLQRITGTAIYVPYVNPRVQSESVQHFHVYLRTKCAPFQLRRGPVVELIPESAAYLTFGDWDGDDFPEWWSWENDTEDVVRGFGGLGVRSRLNHSLLTTKATFREEGCFLEMDFVNDDM